MSQAAPISERSPRAARLSPGPSSIREILFPSDLSPSSDRAFEHAALLARSFAAHVTLLHVVRTPHPLPADSRDPQHDVLRRAELIGREHLERAVRAFPGDFDVLVDRDASVPRALERMVEARRADLVVMATHGRGGVAQLVLGSVAEAMVESGRAPVLCVREPAHGAALPYRRILVPTDLTGRSRQAFPLAAQLAGRFGAEVIALHAAAVPQGGGESGTAGVSYEVEDHLPSEERLRAFLMPEFYGLRIVPRLFVGAAWDRIVESARVERADLIVMSTHGRDSLADRVLGSHAERVLRHAPCPVLVV
jgi:nucleotide-binding universal stress UspA family protein